MSHYHGLRSNVSFRGIPDDTDQPPLPGSNRLHHHHQHPSTIRPPPTITASTQQLPAQQQQQYYNQQPHSMDMDDTSEIRTHLQRGLSEGSASPHGSSHHNNNSNNYPPSPTGMQRVSSTGLPTTSPRSSLSNIGGRRGSLIENGNDDDDGSHAQPGMPLRPSNGQQPQQLRRPSDHSTQHSTSSHHQQQQHPTAVVPGMETSLGSAAAASPPQPQPPTLINGISSQASSTSRPVVPDNDRRTILEIANMQGEEDLTASLREPTHGIDWNVPKQHANLGLFYGDKSDFPPNLLYDGSTNLDAEDSDQSDPTIQEAKHSMLNLQRQQQEQHQTQSAPSSSLPPSQQRRQQQPPPRFRPEELAHQKLVPTETELRLPRPPPRRAASSKSSQHRNNTVVSERSADLVTGIAVASRMSHLPPDQHLVPCAACRNSLLIDKSAVLVQCPKCRAVSPASRATFS